MKIYRYSREKIEKEIECPSYFKFEWNNEDGKTKYFIKVDEQFKTTVMIADSEHGYEVMIEKEVWIGYEDKHFEWSDSTFNEFEKALIFAKLEI